jgi:hypothetical protein
MGRKKEIASTHDVFENRLEALWKNKVQLVSPCVYQGQFTEKKV